MTTVAYRDGVIAADSGCWIGDIVVNTIVKVARGADGSLYGVTGRASECQLFLMWVNGDVPDMPEPKVTNDEKGESSFHALIVRPNGEVALLTAFGYEYYGKPEYISVGAGSLCSMGAMHAGASAVMAIKAAIDHAPGAVAPIRFITRDDPEVKVSIRGRD